MRVDAHQHFWLPARGDYGWLDDGGAALAPLRRPFLPADYAALREEHDIVQTVVVQAAPTDAETDFLVALARHEPLIAAVVGWVDLASPVLDVRLATLGLNRCVRGVRLMLQDLPDDAWIARPETSRGLQALARQGLRLDALVKTRHLVHLEAALRGGPTLSVVIDHAAKPAHGTDDAARELWERGLRALAALPQAVCCKLSGLLTELPPEVARDPTAARRALQPVVDFLLDTFGPQRLIWGSDWPVLNLAADFHYWTDLSDSLLAGVSASERLDIFAGNARRFYDLERPGVT